MAALQPKSPRLWQFQCVYLRHRQLGNALGWRVPLSAVVTLSLSLSPLAASAANAPPKPPPVTAAAAATLIPASQSISLKAPRDIAKGFVTILVSGHTWAQLTLTSQPLKLGAYVASMQFSALGGATRTQLDDPRLHCTADSTCRVDFEITDAKARGTYSGSMDLDVGAEHLATATINLLIPAVGPPPVLASNYLKDDTLDFDATKDDSFFVSITNGVGSPSRSLRFLAAPANRVAATSLYDRLHQAVSCVAPANGPPVAFYPPSVLLDEGASRQVRVEVPPCLQTGSYKSVLEVIDADDGSVIASKELKVSKSEPESWRRWALLFWVVFGATLSVALNNAFPLRRARADRFEELSQAKAKLAGCGSIGSALKGALRSEGQRLWLLIDSVSFVNTRKDAILTEAEQGVSALAQLAAVAESVNSLRAETSELALPIRTLLIIAEHLRAAEDALMRSDVPGAQARVSAATQQAHTMSLSLLAQLEVAPVASHTQLSISLVKSNLSSVDLEDALRGREAQIECNPYARYLDLETFRFRFLNPALSAIPAATQLLDYQWVFDDHTTPPDDGDRCKHFFWKPGRWARMWRWIARRPEPVHTVTVKVTLPPTSLEPYIFTQDIQMQRQRDRASSLGAIQIITFCITTGMAVLAAFGAQYGGVLPIKIDWGAGVTALLFGFGIDQIRDRAASK
jgi:hypothetical protein